MKRTPLVRFIPFRLALLVAPLLAAWPQQSRAGSASWNLNNLGNWNANANWNPNTTFPNGTADVATINNDITAARTISLGTAAQNITVNDLNLGDANGTHGFTIAPGLAGNTLIFGGASPSLDIINGTVHTISAPVQLDADTALRSQTANQHVLSGGLKDGGVARVITFNNDTNGVVRPPANVEGQFSVTTVAAAFNAGTTINIDDVRVNTNFAGALGTAAANSITVSGAGQLYVSGATHVNSVVFNSTGWVENVGNLGAARLENGTVSGAVTLLQDTILGNLANNTGTLSGPISGAFNITKVGGTTTPGQGVILLSGNNASWSGNLTVNRGVVRLSNPASQGTGSTILVDGSNVPVGTFAAGQLGAQLDLAGAGGTFGAAKTLTIKSGPLALNYRGTLLNQAGSNTWQGPIVLDSTEPGGALIQVSSNAAAGTTLTLDNTITATGANYPGLLFLRGAQNGVLTASAVVNMPNTDFAKTEGSTWTINSTGNTWRDTIVADGTLALGATGALDSTSNLIIGQGSATTGQLDMRGFDQTVQALTSNPLSGSAGLIIKNTGAGPSTLTLTTTSLTDAFKGTISGNVSLVKNGAGVLTFNSTTPSVVVPAWTGGSIQVNTGGFGLTGPATLGDATTALRMADGTGLGGEGSLGGDLQLGTSAGLTGLVVEGASASALTVGGVLNVNGTVPIVTTSGFSATGTSRLINVSATPTGTGLPAFDVSGLSLRSPAVAFNALPTPGVDLTYTSIPLKWNGAGGASWDVATTASWQDITPIIMSAMNGDALTLDDLPGADQSIAVSGSVMPGSVTFDNSAFTYTITGTAGSNIATPITKQNTGTAIIAYDNPSTQPATITAGTLQLGNGGTTGVLNGPINNSGALVFNHGTGASVTVPGVISGAGSVTKIGAGTTILTAVSTNNGTHTVSGGVLEVDRDTGNIVPAAVDVLAPGTLRYSRNDAVFAFDRVVTGTGNVELNPHSAAGGTVAHSLTITSVNPGFTGTWVLPSPVTGTYRVNGATPAAYGAGSIDVRSGAQVLAAAGTYTNNIAIAGTGFVDASANIGALRIEGVTWNGNVTVAAGGARIGAHNGTGTVGGNITGGPLEVNVSNYNNPYTVIFTGANSYTATTIGGGNTQTAGPPSMRLNIGSGGTTGSLGTGAVTLNGDGANGVLGFDRSDGYTLGAGNTITGGGSRPDRTFIDFETTGTGFSTGGADITLGTPALGGQLRVALVRTGALATFDSDVTAGSLTVGQTLPGSVVLNNGANVNVGILRIGATATTSNGSSLTINTGSTLTVSGADFGVGDQSLNSGTVTHTGGDVTVGTVVAATRFRLGHWPNAGQTSYYHLSGGSLSLIGPAPLTTPSITGNPELPGGVVVGVDGHGIFNQSGSSTVTANFVLLDARGAAAANASPGEDQYNLDGGTLSLTSNWGLIARHPLSSKFTLNSGTVDNAAASGTAVMLDAPISVGAGGGTLDTSSASSSFVITGSVTGAGNTVNTTGGGKLTLQPNSKTVLDGVSNGLGTTTIEVNLTGDAGVEKIGTGITTLSGTNNYSGGTTVTAGTLVVNGSVTGAGTVASSGTLAGNGSLGAVTAASGSVVSPGLSVGALAFGSLDLQAGSRYDVEITAAATNDKVNVTGALTASGTIKVTLSGYVPVAGNTFDIADGTISGTPTFDFSAAGLTAGLVWDTTMFTSSGTISVILDDPFIAWAAGFGITEGKGGDDDKDGSSNLLEFATNSNPTTGGSGARAFGKLHPLGGDNVLTLTVAVRKSAIFAAAGSTQKATKDKVVYTVEASKDLAIWNVVVVTELNPADSAALQATLTLPTLGSDWEWHSFRTQNGTLLNNLDMIRLSVAAE